MHFFPTINLKFHCDSEVILKGTNQKAFQSTIFTLPRKAMESEDLTVS